MRNLYMRVMAALRQHFWQAVRAGDKRVEATPPSAIAAPGGDDPATGQSSEGGTARALEEISLDCLRPADVLPIITHHSAYHFLVLDPGARRGWLSGGAAGSMRVQAVLAGGSEGDPLRLRAGASACIFIKTGSGYRQVLTSAITYLYHERWFGQPTS